MQQPLPRATPTAPLPPPQQALQVQPAQQQQPTNGILDPGRRYRGWYPRWSLLSATFCALFFAILWLLQKVVCMPGRTSSALCQVNNWNEWWQQTLIVLFIWLVFALGWLIGYLFGVSTLEVSEEHRGAAANFLRSISNYSPVYTLLLVYGGIAFCAIVVVWFIGRFNPFGYAFASILIFIANSCFFYRQSREQQLFWLRGYAVVSLVCMLMMPLFKNWQATILLTEMIIFMIGVRCLFIRPAPVPNAKPEDAAKAIIASSITPAALFMDLLRRWFPRFANANAQNPGGNAGNATPPVAGP